MKDYKAREEIGFMKKDIRLLFRAAHSAGIVKILDVNHSTPILTFSDCYYVPNDNDSISAKLSALINYLGIEYIEEPEKKYFRKKVKA